MARLTAKQAAFAAEYIKDWNATAAAGRAGYSDPNYGRQLLTNPNVAEHLQKLRAKAETKAVMTAQEVLERLSAIARGEGTIPRSTPTGIHELPPDWSDRQRALVELAKYHGIQIDRSEVTVKEGTNARDRLASLLQRQLAAARDGAAREPN